MVSNSNKAYDWVKAYDKTRPVQYERGWIPARLISTVTCIVLRGERKLLQEQMHQAYIQCEYAHAMGNSMGGFKETGLDSQVLKYQGGYIWTLRRGCSRQEPYHRQGNLYLWW